MRLENAIMRSGNAKTISEAKKLIEKTREEAGSNDDYYDLLYKRFGINKQQKKKSRYKPKKIRKVFKTVFQLLILFVSVGAIVLSALNENWGLMVAIFIMGFGLIVFLDKIVENIDRNETFK